jgi:hypothetical protein
MKAGGKHTNKIWSIASAKDTKLTVLCAALWLKTFVLFCGKKIRVHPMRFIL